VFNKGWRASACLMLLAAAALAGCTREDPANPALWRVEDPQGRHGYLFGTIHALPHPAAWHTPRVAAALNDSGLLLVEIAGLNDDGATRAVYNQLAHSPGQPPIETRVTPALRPALARLMAEGGLRSASFDDTETWAAALMLGHVAQGPDEDAGNGVDRALLKGTHLAVAELEGAQKQLGLFDILPESAQRTMLDSVVADAPHAEEDSRALAQAWRRGDMDWIARQTGTGMLADPVLRDVLYERRNRAWVAAVDQQIAKGHRPFVAVGAAHMAGPQGLPALLAMRGYKVTRVE
jgi:uncharacterized protein YbaP (TraB family)